MQPQQTLVRTFRSFLRCSAADRTFSAPLWPICGPYVADRTFADSRTFSARSRPVLGPFFRPVEAAVEATGSDFFRPITKDEGLPLPAPLPTSVLAWSPKCLDGGSLGLLKNVFGFLPTKVRRDWVSFAGGPTPLPTSVTIAETLGNHRLKPTIEASD